MVSDTTKERKSLLKHVFFPEIVLVVVIVVFMECALMLTPDPGNDVACNVVVSICLPATLLLICRLIVVKVQPIVNQQMESALQRSHDDLRRWIDEDCFACEWEKVKKSMAKVAKRYSAGVKIYSLSIAAITCCSIVSGIAHVMSVQDPVLQAVKIVKLIAVAAAGVVFSYVFIEHAMVPLMKESIARGAAKGVKKRVPRE
jgi:hypothetical protein